MADDAAPDLGKSKDQLTLLVIGAVVVGVVALLATQANGTTTNGSPGISGQAATTIAQENLGANQIAANETLGLASITGSLATTEANDRAAIVENAQNGATSVQLATIASNTQQAGYSAEEQIASGAQAADLQYGLKALGVAKDISNNQTTDYRIQGKTIQSGQLFGFLQSLTGGLSSLFTGGFSFGNLFGGGQSSIGGNQQSVPAGSSQIWSPLAGGGATYG